MGDVIVIHVLVISMGKAVVSVAVLMDCYSETYLNLTIDLLIYFPITIVSSNVINAVSTSVVVIRGVV